jgi:phenylpyruvate tautomerase PptA (4-oxalocrotonate tautomerase family)
MPVTQITLLPGYEREVQERLVNRVSDAVRSVINSAEAGTTTFIQEVSTYRRDGRVFTGGGAAHPVASEVVASFLEAMQSRDLSRAKGFLAPDFSMGFPGGARFVSLEDLLAWGRRRYRHVAKRFERFDECWSSEGTFVYCHGTLEGQWPDGSPFEGVRFIDRFVVQNGLLQRQDVWNDLAEHRPG